MKSIKGSIPAIGAACVVLFLSTLLQYKFKMVTALLTCWQFFKKCYFVVLWLLLVTVLTAQILPVILTTLSGGADEVEMPKWNFSLQNTLSNVYKTQYWIKIPDEIKPQMAGAGLHRVIHLIPGSISNLDRAGWVFSHWNITEIFTADELCWKCCLPFHALNAVCLTVRQKSVFIILFLVIW